MWREQPGLSTIGDTPLDIAEEFLRQIQEEDSHLRVGKYGGLIESLRILSSQEIDQMRRQEKEEEEIKEAQAQPPAIFQRRESVEMRKQMKQMASERYLSLEDGKGIDILELQNELHNDLMVTDGDLHEDGAEVLLSISLRRRFIS